VRYWNRCSAPARSRSRRISATRCSRAALAFYSATEVPLVVVIATLAVALLDRAARPEPV
jgi:hypothetical protein